MSIAKSLERMFQPAIEWAAKSYQAALASRLKKYGLRYDDLYDPLGDVDVAEALNRISPEEEMMRNQRLRRALDLSLKHIELDKEMQAKQTPYDFYLTPVLLQIQKENSERAKLGATRLRERSIP
mmetsp:Transcript_9750/g.35719  ORF Transcript_9750/g.35719 Transcript_9750/m.35719 type:complete len:125 (+) Transcript_9750:184-558(+)